jgi:hypothetical protein
MVAEIIESDCKGIDNDAQDVAPSPLQLSVEIQGTRNWWTKYSKRDRRRQHQGIHGTSQAIGHEFTEADVERQLSGCSETIDGVGSLHR